MVYVISLIIWGVIWGFATNAVLKNKGYDDNWFWWGFFFWFIALIVAATKPENRGYSTSNNTSYNSVLSEMASESEAQRRNSSRSSDTWQCYKCNRVNQKYVTTCVCGVSKADSMNYITNRQKSFGTVSQQSNKKGWVCSNCGLNNSKLSEKCSCGMLREYNAKWICDKCGSLNGEKQFICQCGAKKSENSKKTLNPAEINEYLNKKNTKVETVKKNEDNTIDSIESIKKYKELLDMGAITQEEFDKKKKELL